MDIIKPKQKSFKNNNRYSIDKTREEINQTDNKSEEEKNH